MQVEHHDLDHEFPEFAAVITQLKQGDAQFSRLFDEYNGITAEIERLEEEDLPVDDFTIEEMKKKRVHLKDELYTLLVRHKAA
ncbi:MAG TPA: YdcH family protein [Rhodocyclaceae bacterium]|nr:YdcH family protein [Rhodocyclaceae bacterium]HNH35676.1 YdcH family protein [Rhodocyclaceae bacterium]